MNFKDMAEQNETWIIEQRRYFHAHPELSFEEKNTTQAIGKRLEEMGLTPHFYPDYNGLWAMIEGGKSTPDSKTVALRADIDALPIEEHTALPFCSQNPGVMHACGHDGHATIGLGVAKVLMSIKDQLHGTVKLIFQPAEEGVRGAKSIVDNGHLDGVDYLIGSHVTNKKEDDPAVVIPGSYGSLATTKYDVIFHGKSAHAGGSPEVGRNVMLAVGTAILNLYAIPRHSGGVSRVNVGTVVAGSGRNVIADEAKMEIEVRGETTEINEYMKNYAVNIIESAAKNARMHL